MACRSAWCVPDLSETRISLAEHGPKPFIMSPAKAAKLIRAGLARNREIGERPTVSLVTWLQRAAAVARPPRRVAPVRIFCAEEGRLIIAERSALRSHAAKFRVPVPGFVCRRGEQRVGGSGVVDRPAFVQ